MRWLHALPAVAMNAVPIVGVMAYGWSVPTILLLFWLENVAMALAHCVRIAAHRRLSRRAGHWQHTMTVNGVERPATLLAGYAVTAGAFTFGHGIFVCVFAFLVIPQSAGSNPTAQFDAVQFWLGARAMVAIALVDFALDLHGLRARSYAWIERETSRRIGRVIVLHVGLILGAMALAAAPVGMLMVLLGLKALVDVGMALASAAPATSSTVDAKGRKNPETVLTRIPRRR
jgi:hypothetical protein